MECQQCHHINRLEAKFCDQCGQALAATAPATRTDCLREAVIGRFHTQLPSYTPKHLTAKILASKSATEGERKQVTVLFADVAGFTTMCEQLDPEAVHVLMDGCFERLTTAIHRYEGTVNQYTGDGIMALFGTPIAHEDHPQRALLAASAIQEAMALYSAQVQRDRGLDFRLRIGINTGLVVVGRIGDELCDQRGDAGLVVGRTPARAGGAHRNVELGFGDINTNKHWALGHRRLLTGPTLQDTGSMAPDNGSGSGRSGCDDPDSLTVSPNLRDIGLSRPGSE